MKINKISSTKIINNEYFSLFIQLLQQKIIKWKQTPFKFEGSGKINGVEYKNVYKKTIFGTIVRNEIPSKNWSYAFIVWGYSNGEDDFKHLIKIRLNGKTEPFAMWNDIENIQGFFDKVNITLSDTPSSKSDEEKMNQEIESNKSEYLGKDTFYKKRFTKIKDKKWVPLELILLLRRKKSNFSPTVLINPLDSTVTPKETLASSLMGNEEPEEGFDYRNSLEVIKNIEQHLTQELGFVDKSDYNYIPEGANKYNYDFYLNKFKKDIDSEEGLSDNFDIDDIDVSNEEDFEISDSDMGFDDLFKGSSFNPKIKKAQNNNFEGYYSGEIPDYAANMIGTSNVDASQIESSFGKSREAIAMVNEFDSSFLKNIAYIFNFAQGSAYGVYIPQLDEAIKTKALHKELENRGYTIKEENGMLVAYHDKKAPEEIQQEIDSIYNPLKAKGGHVISLNTSKILNDAKMDVEAVYPLVEAVWTENETWENFSILHLGETIVHEATHAQGYDDEGMPTQQQQRFVEFALNKMNQKLQSDMNNANLGDQFQPIPSMTSTRRASLIKFKNKLIKNAQSFIPQHLLNKPVGSDLEGRYKGMNDRVNPNWGLVDQYNSTAPIETKLGRGFMAPLPDGLSQEHDHIDLQLRKYNAEDEVNDPSFSIERLLTEFHGDEDSYELVETLLERKRPKPLMIPISKKEASSNNRMIKEAYQGRGLFGWYNNLEISDGSTIPGLGDRVMAWDDRDESFAKEEDWIRSQPRYNPKDYTVKGFRYEWVEIRFKPTLWEDTVSQNIGNISPARRFASNEDPDAQDKKELNEILTVISMAKSQIKQGKIKGTRFLISEEILPYIKKLFEEFPGTFFEIDCFSSKIKNQRNVYSLWVVNDEVSERNVQEAEDFMQGKDEEGYASAEYILERNYSEDVHKVIDEGIKICKNHNIDIQVVGESARKVIQDNYNLENLDFCGTIEETTKFAHILAEQLGVSKINYVNKNQIISYFYNGVRLDFNVGFYPDKLISKKRLAHFSNVHKDLINRDFKLNMVGYSLYNGKINNPFKVNLDSNTLEMLFEPRKLFSLNPNLILRILSLVLEDGYVLEKNIEDEIKSRGEIYLKKCSFEKINYYRERLEFCGINKLNKCLENLNLNSLAM